jgi:hypothetical protein
VARRTWQGALALGAVLSALLVPTQAMASTSPVITAVAPAPGDPGRLRVTASSDSAITGFTVTLKGPWGGPTTVTVTALHLISGTGSDGQWETDGRIVLTDYGRYDVTTTAVDADGDVTATPFTSIVDYQWQVVAGTVTHDRASLDHLHPSLTVTGQVDKLDPRTGTRSAWSGLNVDLASAGDGSVQGITAADGSFSLTLRPQTPVDARTVAYNVYAGAQLVHSGSYTEHLAPTRITATSSASRVPFGSDLTITGTLELFGSGAWSPAPAVALSYAGGETPGQVTTDDSGSFTVSTRMVQSGTVHVDLSSYTTHPWLADSSASFPTSVVVRTTVEWFQPAINEFSELTVHGSVVPLESSFYPAGGKVYVQRSADGRTGWTTLGYLRISDGGSFDVAAYLSNPAGYFRLYGVPSGDFAPSYSRVVHLSRTLTRVSKASTPAHVRKGAGATFSGVVQKKVGTAWKPIPRARVYIFFRAKGATAFRQMATARASSTGRFAIGIRPPKDGTWAAVWFTSGTTYVNAYSKQRYIDVR